MTKDIDVSKIDVGWRVQLNCGAVPKCAAFYDKWITVIEVFKGGFIGEFEGKRIPFNDHPQSFLAALPPEPAKDPFAVGEWVVCVEDDYPARGGDVFRVFKTAHNPMLFRVKDNHPLGFITFYKSRFRPATPEEIAAHLEKTATKGSEPKIEPKGRRDDGPETDGKITFTVAGRKFFVGQRVYANTIGTAGLGKLIDVPHEVTGCVAMAELVCIREMDGFNQRVIAASCLSEAPLHEWQFGDQASHPDHGKVIVIDMTEPEAFQCSSPSDPEIFIDPSELTFIRRTDLGA